MIDSVGRRITYLRLSVTDRCNLRCAYCMAEDPTFLAKADMLSLEELERLCGAFIRKGVRRIRLTGGEPLVRRGIIGLIERLGDEVAAGRLDELTLTTNGILLARHAEALAVSGVRRVNVSLDTLDPAKFAAITRRGRLAAVLEGIAAAKAAGLAIKINAVVLAEVNEYEIDDLVSWCGVQGLDLCLIEAMPMGSAASHARYVPLSRVRAHLERQWTLTATNQRTAGPARYVEIAETGRLVGFITPLSDCFCSSCNRVRVTCTGTLYPCLGQDQAIDLRAPLRASESDHLLDAAIEAAVAAKPSGHDFVDSGLPKTIANRPMSATGG